MTRELNGIEVISDEEALCAMAKVKKKLRVVRVQDTKSFWSEAGKLTFAIGSKIGVMEERWLRQLG